MSRQESRRSSGNTSLAGSSKKVGVVFCGHVAWSLKKKQTDVEMSKIEVFLTQISQILHSSVDVRAWDTFCQIRHNFMSLLWLIKIGMEFQCTCI